MRFLIAGGTFPAGETKKCARPLNPLPSLLSAFLSLSRVGQIKCSPWNRILTGNKFPMHPARGGGGGGRREKYHFHVIYSNSAVIYIEMPRRFSSLRRIILIRRAATSTTITSSSSSFFSNVISLYREWNPAARTNAVAFFLFLLTAASRSAVNHSPGYLFGFN